MHVTVFVRLHIAATQTQAAVTNVATETESAQPDQKKFRSNVAEFEDVDETPQVQLDEVTGYLQTRVTSVNQDLLAWWKNQSQYPKLQTLARQIFAVPASSAASERSFSAAGVTVSARRTALSPGHVDDILFIHSNKI